MLRRRVVIVGGGPVGLYASAQLSRLGVPSLLVERESRGSSHPRAHLINTRTVEVLRELGLERRLHALAPPPAEWRHFRYCSTLLGQQIAAQDHLAGREWDELRAASPVELTHVSQPLLESILRQEAEARAASCPGAEVLFNREVRSLRQAKDGSFVHLELGAPAAASESVEADVVLACDGSHSLARRAIGVQMRGPPALQHFYSVHFRAPQLGSALRARGVADAMLYFALSPKAIAVVVAHSIGGGLGGSSGSNGDGEWVAQLPFFPALQGDDPYDDAEVIRQITAAIGEPLEVSLLARRRWSMVANVADRLSVGRVHLIGDAAHQFPPAGGFGMNTGLQDAHNLCWKVAAVHHGVADPSLLRSYDAERRPVALTNASLSVHNCDTPPTPPSLMPSHRASLTPALSRSDHRGLRVAAALGLPTMLPHHASRAIDAAAQLVPSPLAAAVRSLRSVKGSTGITRAAFETARTHLIGSIGHAAPHALGRLRLREAERVVRAGEALPLIFPRHELGYVYGGPGAAVHHHVADDVSDGATWQKVEVEEKTLEDERYVPSTAPGSRLPHSWLQICSADGTRGKRISTLDLAHEPVGAATTPLFTLLVDMRAADTWGPAARLLPASLLRSVAVITDDSPGADTASALPGAAAHVDIVAAGEGWVWPSMIEAVLVRPDGHVAWRAAADGTDHDVPVGLSERQRAAARLLAEVMSTILGKDVASGSQSTSTSS